MTTRPARTVGRVVMNILATLGWLWICSWLGRWALIPLAALMGLLVWLFLEASHD